MRILAIYGSPREGGNSDTLLDEFVRGAEEAGASVTKRYLRDMPVVPCTECDGCNDTGICIFDDDYQRTYEMLDDINAMIIASPIFFYGMTAITKAFIDRSQQFWIAKYRIGIGNRAKEEKKRAGYFLSVGGTEGPKIFDGSVLTMKYFYDALDFEFKDSFLFRGIDAKGDADTRKDAFDACYNAGKNIVLNR